MNIIKIWQACHCVSMSVYASMSVCVSMSVIQMCSAAMTQTDMLAHTDMQPKIPDVLAHTTHIDMLKLTH